MFLDDFPVPGWGEPLGAVGPRAVEVVGWTQFDVGDLQVAGLPASRGFFEKRFDERQPA